MSYDSGVIMLVISNRPRALLTRLLPELYSTQTNYRYHGYLGNAGGGVMEYPQRKRRGY